MLIPDSRRTPLPNLISHNGVILYQWEFLRARLDEGEGLPWIAMEPNLPRSYYQLILPCTTSIHAVTVPRNLNPAPAQAYWPE